MWRVNPPAVSQQLSIIQSYHPQQRYTFIIGSFKYFRSQKYNDFLKCCNFSAITQMSGENNKGFAESQCSTNIWRPKVWTAHCHGNPNYLPPPPLKLSIPHIKIMALVDFCNRLLTTGFFLNNPFVLVGSFDSGGDWIRLMRSRDMFETL